MTLACITGASSGLGKELAHLFAEKKIPLLLSGRDEKRLQELSLELQKYVQVEVFACDLSKKEERKKWLSLIQEKTPDLIINCAGWGLYGDILNHTTEESLAMIEVDVQALVEISIESARSLKKANRKGCIVNISSAAAFLAYPTFCIYAAAKAFVKQFSLGFDAEVKPDGIRVLSSCPGQFESDFQRRAGKNRVQKKYRVAMSTRFAAEEVWKQIEKQKALHVFDWRYRLIVCLLPLIPQKLLNLFLKNSLKDRHD